MKKPKLCVLTGPTAVGKSSLSINLAKALDTEIISGDSMQIYKNMRIGTARISESEMMGVRHHMLNFVDPLCNYDVVSFKENAEEIIKGLIEDSRIPLIVGGTGFYIRALCYDTHFSDNADMKYREELFLLAQKHGNEYLHNMLKKVDPQYAVITHANNLKRVIRALEFYKENDYPLSKHNQDEKERTTPYDLYYFVLTRERSLLYEAIDKRVDDMMNEGLLDEVKALKELGVTEGMTSYNALGYKQLFMYLDGEISLDEAVYEIKKQTRHFAKRQLTWFRGEKDVIFIDKDSYENEMQIIEFIKERMGL